MSAYTFDEEEKTRIRSLLGNWQRSGFLELSQVQRLDADLQTGFKRTNASFRLLLAVFALVIVIASIALVATVLHFQSQQSMAGLCAVFGILCAGIAAFLVRRFRLYRFGVEETLAGAAPILLGVAVIIGTAAPLTVNVSECWGLGVAAVSFLGVYLWFGYVWTAVASMACAAAIPCILDLSDPVRRVVIATFFLALFLVMRRKRLDYGDDFPGNRYALLQAAALVGLYVAINAQIGPYRDPRGIFYWFTYALTFLIPALGLRLGLQTRDRWLIDAGVIMALGALATNKPYLGLVHQPWDPILLGILLMGSAVALRRWLAKGEQGERHGYTSARLLASDARILSVIATASAALPGGRVSDTAPSQPRPDFGGGRSGGAGASGEF
jgi:hypothetical protein